MLHPVMLQWVAVFTNSNEGKESSHLSMRNAHHHPPEICLGLAKEA
jgi:hypothetical protein